MVSKYKPIFTPHPYLLRIKKTHGEAQWFKAFEQCIINAVGRAEFKKIKDKNDDHDKLTLEK